MAQAPPPPQPPPRAWYAAPAPRPATNPALVILLIVFVVILFLGMGATLVGVPGAAFAGVLCIPVLVVIAALVFAFAGFTRRRTIPPPPPIQQRMVPAGQHGPVAVDCPNCGGPPTNVDRFGIATCSYCGTRYLVR